MCVLFFFRGAETHPVRNARRPGVLSLKRGGLRRTPPFAVSRGQGRPVSPTSPAGSPPFLPTSLLPPRPRSALQSVFNWSRAGISATLPIPKERPFPKADSLFGDHECFSRGASFHRTRGRVVEGRSMDCCLCDSLESARAHRDRGSCPGGDRAERNGAHMHASGRWPELVSGERQE